MILAAARANPRVTGMIVGGVAVLLLVGGSYGLGRWQERAAWKAEIAKVEAARDAAAERATLLAEQMQKNQAERRAEAEKLDKEARDAPNATRPALSRDSVRRLRLNP